MQRNHDPQSQKVDGKQRLLNAARVLFAQGGFDDASVADILDLSNLKAPSLYHHYGDKEGLYTVWATNTLSTIGTEISNISHKTPLVLAQTILSGSTIDILQIQRDLRALKNQNNVDAIRQSLQTNLVDPVADCLLEAGVPAPELKQRTNYFLHSIMYAHPAYALGRLDPDIDGHLTEWIVKEALTNLNIK